MKKASARKANRSSSRQRSKHQTKRQKMIKKEIIALLVVASLAAVASVAVILVDILKISVIEVGLPISSGVYQIKDGGQELSTWGVAEGEAFVGQYQIDYNFNEEYTIRNVYSNLVVTGEINLETRQIDFKLAAAVGSCSQRWLMTFEDSGNRLISACDVRAQSQILQFQNISSSLELPAPTKQAIENGVYAFVPSANPQGVIENTTAVSLQIVEKDNSPQQLFEIAFDTLGYYSIYNLDQAAYLDVSEIGDLRFSAERKLYCGQAWSIVRDKADYKVISSCTGYVLGALDGVNVGTNTMSDDISAMWQIEPRRTILFVGDSITYGQTSCNYNSNYCRSVLTNAVNSEMSILNREQTNYIEINLGNPGATASGYLYGIDQAYLDKLKQYRVEIAQIMLGTNDSARGVAAATYTKNIAGIINALSTAGVKIIILNRPIYNAVSPRLLVEYFTGLSGLVDNQTVFLGDSQGYDWFKQNYWHLDGGGSGFHPDQEGYRMLGELWAAAFRSVVGN